MPRIHIHIAYSLVLLLILGSCKKETIPTSTGDTTQVARFMVIEDNVNGVDVVIAGSRDLNLIVSYERRLEDGTALQFESVAQELPRMLLDQEGNVWDVFGRAVEGPRLGQRLTPTYSMMAYWFSIAAHYPGMEVHGLGSSSPMLNLSNDPDWNIPLDNVEWGSAWDAIPAIDNPNFLVYNARDYLSGFFIEGQDLVIGTEVNGQARAYPHAILNYHEVVNDVLGGENLTVAWCPLAGTSTIWARDLQQVETTFRVAGLLYNNNLLMYDRDTESIWSQVRGDCVFGDRRGQVAEHYPMIETTWQTWQKLVEEPEILSTETGVNRDYSLDEFEYYKSVDDEIYYPLDYLDPRLPFKERVHTIIVGQVAKAYRFSNF